MSLILSGLCLHLLNKQYEASAGLSHHYSSVNASVLSELDRMRQILVESNDRYEGLEAQIVELKNRLAGNKMYVGNETNSKTFAPASSSVRDKTDMSNLKGETVGNAVYCSSEQKPAFLYIGLGLAGLVGQQCGGYN